MIRGVLLDIDGTLIDSNDAHAHAWREALAQGGFPVPFDRVRSLIGVGSDKLIPALTNLPPGPRAEHLADRRAKIFRATYLPGLRPFPGTRGFLEELGRRKLLRVATTSATADDLQALLEQTGIAGLMDAIATGDDVDRSKPDPDVVAVALRKAGLRADEAILVGDTPYDLSAARRAGVVSIAVRSGGWSDEDLRGASAVVRDVGELGSRLGEILARGR